MPMRLRLRLRQSFGVLALSTAFTRHRQRKLEHSILEVNAELRTVNAVCSFARSSPCIPTGCSPTILPKNMLLTCRFSASLLARIGSAVRREAFRASGGDRRLIRMDHTDSPGRLLGDLMLRGARITGGDLRDLEIRDSQVDGLRILDSIGTTVSVSGALQKIVVHDVDVTAHVQGVLDARNPGRREAREAETPEDFRGAWQIVQARWDELLSALREAPSARAHASVNGEWSLVQTLRHLRFAADTWIGTAVLAEPSPHHPWGLPAGGTPREIVDELGLEPAAEPTLAQVLEVRAARRADVEHLLTHLTEDELDRVCTGTPGPGYPECEYRVRRCLRVVLTEEVEHLRYAVRDLAMLARDEA